MIRRYIIEADDSLKGFDEAIEKLEREWGAEEIEGSEDCVSREAVLEQAIDYGSKTFLIPVNSVKALPSVQPQPKRGKWISIDATHSMCEKCEAIFEITSPNAEVNFCPSCGVLLESEMQI